MDDRAKEIMNNYELLDYNLYVLREMVGALPQCYQKPFLAQIGSVQNQMAVAAKCTTDAAKETIAIMESTVIENTSSVISDIRLTLSHLRFDLNATKNEKDALQKIVDDIK